MSKPFVLYPLPALQLPADVHDTDWTCAALPLSGAGMPGTISGRLQVYWPSHTLWLPVYAYCGNPEALEIKLNGTRSCSTTPAATATSMGYSSFDEVSFRVP